ncbi:hypothetical protein [Acidiphilium sp.]|uniref:hypothetical protein n=1 Tax=Acidiphilium sp. TaxID=527 RepID=UPI003CFDACDC
MDHAVPTRGGSGGAESCISALVSGLASVEKEVGEASTSFFEKKEAKKLLLF